MLHADYIECLEKKLKLLREENERLKLQMIDAGIKIEPYWEEKRKLVDGRRRMVKARGKGEEIS